MTDSDKQTEKKTSWVFTSLSLGCSVTAALALFVAMVMMIAPAFFYQSQHRFELTMVGVIIFIAWIFLTLIGFSASVIMSVAMIAKYRNNIISYVALLALAISVTPILCVGLIFVLGNLQDF